jgi:dolichol kinase
MGKAIGKNSAKSEILRKAMHMVLTLLLLIPLTPFYRTIFSYFQQFSIDPTLLTYSILLFIFSLINSIQIKLPHIEETIASISREHRKRFVDYISENFANTSLSEFVKGIEKIISKYENQLLAFMNIIERDYEKKYGYVSVTFALISVFLSYTLWKDFTYVGILALSIVDGLTSLISTIDKRSKKIFKHTLFAYAVAIMAFSILTYLITHKPLLSIVISIVTVIIEMISPEDNLTLPLLTTTLFSILNNMM